MSFPNRSAMLLEADMLLDKQIKLRRYIRSRFPRFLKVEEPKYRGYLEEFSYLRDLIPLRYRLYSVIVRKLGDNSCSKDNWYEHVYFLDRHGNVLYRSRWAPLGRFSMLIALRRAKTRADLGNVRQVVGMTWWYYKFFPYCQFVIYKIPKGTKGDQYLATLVDAHDRAKQAEREWKKVVEIEKIKLGRLEAQADPEE